MKHFLNILAIVFISTLSLSAGSWENYSNMTQITDAMPIGDHIWMTAKGGVIDHNKLTGENFYYKKGTAGLPSFSVEQIELRESDNTIFIGTYENGVALMQDGNWINYPFPVSMNLYRMKFDSFGDLWIQADAGLYKFDGDTHDYTFINSVGGAGWDFDAWDFDITPDNHVIVFTGTTSLVIDAATNAVIDSFESSASPVVLSCSPATVRVYGVNSDTYLIANGGSWEFEFRDGTTAPGTDGLPGDGFNGNILRGKDNILYTVYSNFGGTALYRLEGTSWVFVKDLDVDYNFELLYADGADFYINEYAYGSAPRLFTVNDTETKALTVNEFAFTSNNIQGITEDAAGNIIASSAGDLYTYNTINNNWDLYSAAPVTYDILQQLHTANGNIYGIDYGHLITWFDGSTWNHIPLAAGYSSIYIYDYDVTTDGTIYFVNDEGLFKYEDGTTVLLLEAESVWDPYLCVKYDATRDLIWIGKIGGIIKYDFTSAELIDASDVPAMSGGSVIQKIAVDENNNVWFGANLSNAYMFNGTDWSDYTMPNDAGDFITNFAFNGSKVYFGLTDGSGGIYVYDTVDDTWTLFNNSTDEHMVSNNITQLHVTSNGSIWASTPDAGIEVYRTESTPDAITNVIADTDLTIFPNPVVNTLSFSMQFDNAVNIRIIDAAGKTVLESYTSTSIVELENLNGGIYIVQVTDPKTGAQYTKKFVKE